MLKVYNNTYSIFTCHISNFLTFDKSLMTLNYILCANKDNKFIFHENISWIFVINVKMLLINNL